MLLKKAAITPARPKRAKTRSFPSKAAGEKQPEAYPLGYVEDFDDPRTQLEAFFSSLYSLICPLPNTTNFEHVSSSSPIGPRA